MLEAGIAKAAYAGIWDPVTVQVCAEAGVGSTIALRLDGKCGPASGDPMDVVATVRSFVPGHGQQGMGPEHWSMGDSVWLQISGIDVVVMSLRTQIFSPDAFTGLGIDLAAKRLIAVKSSWHSRRNSLRSPTSWSPWRRPELCTRISPRSSTARSAIRRSSRELPVRSVVLRRRADVERSS